MTQRPRLPFMLLMAALVGYLLVGVCFHAVFVGDEMRMDSALTLATIAGWPIMLVIAAVAAILALIVALVIMFTVRDAILVIIATAKLYRVRRVR